MDEVLEPVMTCGMMGPNTWMLVRRFFARPASQPRAFAVQNPRLLCSCVALYWPPTSQTR